jgi:heat shock protein HslJ
MAGNVAESVYTDALKNAASYRRNGNVLRMYDRRGRKTLEFTRILGGDRDDSDDTDRWELEDRKWVLEQIRGRQTLVALPKAFLNFDERKGSAGGDTSCNVFGGSYRTSGETIAFTDIIGTMRACVEDDRMSVERDFMDGLRAANRYEIRNGRLYLFKGKQILLTFRGDNK